jgi:hypothetical protein
MSRGFWRPLTSVALCVSAAACSAAVENLEQPGTPVAVIRFRAEPYSFMSSSGLWQPARVIVRDEATWRSTWSAIWSGTSPVPEVPVVDFDREMIVVAALGSRPTGGYGILVQSANVNDDGLMITIRTIAPGPHCGTTQAFTQPVDLARIPRLAGEVRFTDDPVVLDCG